MSTREENLLVDIRHNQGDFETTKTGDLSRITAQDNLKQALNHRLITVPGTFAFRPLYGVGIQNYQGALTTLDSQRRLALAIRDQFLEDPRVESVDSVRFEVDDKTPDKFLIFVKYTALGYNELEETFDPFELGA